MCYNSHQGILRASGVQYYTHPLSVAMILIEELNINDTATIVAALLHNVIRDNPMINYQYLSEHYGNDVSTLLLYYSKFIKHDIDNDNHRNNTRAETYLQLFVLIIRDIRTFMLQLANRLHDLRTLQYISAEKQKEIAEETLNFYVPLVHQYGFFKLKAEIEKLAFFFYNPIQYQWILNVLKVKKNKCTERLYILIDNIKKILSDNNITSSINVSHIQEYELFLRIQAGENINDIDNIFSLSIVWNSYTETSCENIQQLLLENLRKSYIDITKSTAPTNDGSTAIDIVDKQDRTRIIIKSKNSSSDDNQLLQILANSDYKHNYTNISEEDIGLWCAWMVQIIDSKVPVEAERILWKSIKDNLYNELISVFDKNGKQYMLPNGAFVIDFAFAISDAIGLNAITCKVNGSVKDIFYKLNNGDIVEMITHPKCHPDSSWINYAVTFKAVAKLNSYLKNDFVLNYNNKHLSEQEFKRFHISSIEHNNILPIIKNAIGQNNIHRIFLSNNLSMFNIAVHTNIPADTNTNTLFTDLIMVKGIKSISIDTATI